MMFSCSRFLMMSISLCKFFSSFSDLPTFGMNFNATTWKFDMIQRMLSFTQEFNIHLLPGMVTLWPTTSIRCLWPPFRGSIDQTNVPYIVTPNSQTGGQETVLHQISIPVLQGLRTARDQSLCWHNCSWHSLLIITLYVGFYIGLKSSWYTGVPS